MGDKAYATNRPRYRAGRKETLVKAYTINQESRFLIVKNVPALGAQDELMKLFALYGTIVEYRLLDEEDAVEFTDVYWIKFERIEEARIAKRKCDDYNFLGHLLEVSYAPQFESVSDMREKLEERKRIISRKLRQNYNDAVSRQKGVERSGPGQVAHQDMPFEPPPDFAKTNMEMLQVPQYRNASTQLYNQNAKVLPPPPPPRPISNNNNTNSTNNVNVPPPPPTQKQKHAPRIPAQVPGQALVSTYYGDSSVNASVMNIRNKLKRISEPVMPTGVAPSNPPAPARPAQRRRI